MPKGAWVDDKRCRHIVHIKTNLAIPALAEPLRPTTTVILANLSFLFVPAGVGVIGNFEVLLDDGVALLVILTLSTVLSMLAAVGTFVGVQRLTEGRAT